MLYHEEASFRNNASRLFLYFEGDRLRSSTAFIWLTPICWSKSEKDDIKSMTFLMSHMIKENDSMTFSHDVWFFKSASFFDTYSLIKSDDWVKSIVMMTWNFLKNLQKNFLKLYTTRVFVNENGPCQQSHDKLSKSSRQLDKNVIVFS